ncbi:MAG: N-acetyl-gamma-glutamyl-phosphate reductase [Bacteroidales bacterium]|nr:N-acetyl-gamma-glutamyl-phosphate reductase [Bacteroidales bacterium]MBQ6870886.1 N-acetyl-gamma-glutamyl-phosphate reductase [Bacteroidales bacterium]
MIKVAIAGATGYTAGELIRILLNHPQVEIESVLSTTSAGQSVCDIHRDLIGETDLKFTDKPVNPDVVFLCLGHGLSREFLDNTPLPEHCKIIDLGNDFRLDPDYKGKEFIYGLTDTFKEEILKAEYIANPGCFATAIQTALTPLAKAGILESEVHVTALTGSTGAGKKPGETTHFSYRDNNLSIYKLFTHQHLGEIKRTLSTLLGHEAPQINFVPMRGDFTRGIFASVYTKWNGYKGAEGSLKQELEDAVELYNEYYKDSPFVFISSKGVSLKEVVNTNKILLHIELHQGYIHISSVIDNLVKGASGQAVENMNLIFGLEQTMGLKLKPSAF